MNIKKIKSHFTDIAVNIKNNALSHKNGFILEKHQIRVAENNMQILLKTFTYTFELL